MEEENKELLTQGSLFIRERGERMVLQNDQLVCLMTKPPRSQQWVRETIEELWRQMRFFIREYKEICDSLTHEDVEIVNENSNHIYFRRVLREFISDFGLMSWQVQSLMKMAVEVELSSKKVREDYKKSKQPYAPAFLPELIAAPDLGSEMGKRVASFFRDARTYRIEDKQWQKRHPNAYRLIKTCRKHFKKYMEKELKPRMYVLTNGSSTRLQDHVNITDINGIVYMTEEEESAVENRWNKIIEFFKMMNFDEDIEYCVISSFRYYGTINVAPDDSGKTRISYCIDPVVQVISKAVAKCLDYVSRKLPSNCTKDQMRIIRKIVKERWNENCYILSLDMSKYSDTLQFTHIANFLLHMGMPADVVEQLSDLYSLPMYDTVKEVVTPCTSASYQGQYGDFSMITLLNISTQCDIYDYYGEYYELEKEEDVNAGAVGDDTIMVFLREHRDLFEVAQQFYAHLGVKINKTKTHTLFKGSGTADFIKRFVTKDGLIPYLRFAPFFTLDMNSWIEELLRFGRNNLDSDLFTSLCHALLPEKEAEFTVHLSWLNGGINDRELDESDIKLFCYRDERLSFKYSLKHEDDMRRWISIMHSRGIQLVNTALIGFCPHYEEVFGSEEEWGDDYEEHFWTQENASNMERATEDGILHNYSHGYERASLSNLQDLIGLTKLKAKKYRPDLAKYLEDYNRDEVYRFIEGQDKRVRRISVYTEMMEFDPAQFVLPEQTVRTKRIVDYSELGRAHNTALGLQAIDLFCNHCSSHGWVLCSDICYETERSYLLRNGQERRMYSLSKPNSRSRVPLSFSEFYEVIAEFCRDEDHAREMHSLFLENLPHNSYVIV